MATVEQICTKNEGCLDITPFEVCDIEIFKIDWARYLNAQRKTKNITVILRYSEDIKCRENPY